MTIADSKTGLALLKGGRLTAREFAALTLQEKIDCLHHQRGAIKARTILEDPKPELLVRSLPMEDLYQILHDLGPENSLEILQLAAPQQVRFILDWELWEEWSISMDKTAEWLELILADEERAAQTIAGLDQELLLVFLKKTIAVGGGLGDIVNSEDHQVEWDHTFDEIYYIRFLDSSYSQLVLRLTDLLYREDQPLYRSLMQGVENELLSELEELAGQFRRSRLADEGFPSLHDASAIYAWTPPDSFTPGKNKVNAEDGTGLSPFPLLVTEPGSLLGRAFVEADSEALRRELHYLANSAMVAEGVTPADHAGMLPVMERIANYLNIALEFLCADAGKGAEIIRGEHLQRLFSLGHSLLLQLKERAGQMEGGSYAADRVLMGLRMRRPRYYRGLDPDTIDDYREFTGMDDVRRVDDFLKGLANG